MHPLKALLTTLLLCFPLASYAQEPCDDMWFVRNLIFDQNGYCFGSNLGQAVFDNSNCITKSPDLSKDDKAKIAAVKNMEGRWGCKIDTSKRALDIHSFALRKKLLDQPLRDDTESSCITYQGPPVPLHAGQSTNSPIIGYIQTGDTFGNSHTGFPDTAHSDWWYVSAIFTTDGTTRTDIGWTNKNHVWSQCLHMAG